MSAHAPTKPVETAPKPIIIDDLHRMLYDLAIAAMQVVVDSKARETDTKAARDHQVAAVRLASKALALAGGGA